MSWKLSSLSNISCFHHLTLETNIQLKRNCNASTLSRSCPFVRSHSNGWDGKRTKKKWCIDQRKHNIFTFLFTFNRDFSHEPFFYCHTSAELVQNDLNKWIYVHEPLFLFRKCEKNAPASIQCCIKLRKNARTSFAVIVSNSGFESVYCLVMGQEECHSVASLNMTDI